MLKQEDVFLVQKTANVAKKTLKYANFAMLVLALKNLKFVATAKNAPQIAVNVKKTHAKLARMDLDCYQMDSVKDALKTACHVIIQFALSASMDTDFSLKMEPIRIHVHHAVLKIAKIAKMMLLFAPIARFLKTTSNQDSSLKMEPILAIAKFVRTNIVPIVALIQRAV